MAIGRTQSVVLPKSTCAVAVARTPWCCTPTSDAKMVVSSEPCARSRNASTRTQVPAPTDPVGQGGNVTSVAAMDAGSPQTGF